MVIESPRHDADLTSLNDAEIAAVVTAYRDRTRALLQRPGISAVVLYRNHGSRSGASLQHPHAQAIATPLTPSRVAAWTDWGRSYHAGHGRCATCEEIAIERANGIRVVDESAHFLVLVPFAAEVPAEIWILPKRH